MELYINNFKVNINERLPFPLTYNISDVKNLAARKGNNSKTITLPGTKGNIFLMFNAFSLSVTQSLTGNLSSFDFDPTIKATARYYEQGLLMFNGYCQLIDCEYLNGEWSFNIVLFSDQIDYIAKLTQIKINELDWSAYNHDCTRDNQTDSWAGTVQVNAVPTSNKTGANWDGFGYYYGLIDYGFSRATPSTFNVEHIAPQVFCYEILQKSFESVGITWNSSFLESQTFKRLLMAYEGGTLPSVDAATSAQYSSTNDEVNKASGYIIEMNPVVNEFIPIGGSLRIGNYTDLVLQQPVWVNTVTDPEGQMTGEEPFKFQAEYTGLYTLEYSGDHDVTFDFTIAGATITDADLRFKFGILLLKNGVFLDNLASSIIYNVNLDNGTGDVTGSVSFNYSQSINLEINDEITILYRTQIIDSSIIVNGSPTSFSTNINTVSVDAQINMIKQQQEFFPGTTVQVNQFLPNMDAATFFKGITTAFNLYVKPSVDDPTILEIEPLNDFYDTAANALNWSDKVDYSKSLKVTPTINFSSRYYNFKFTDDNDYYNSAYLKDTADQYGSFIVDSQTQFSKESTDFTLPFSQKLLVNIPVDDTTFTGIIVPRSFQVRFDDNGASSINIAKGKPFLVQLGPMTSANWTHIDENGLGHAETSYPYVGHLNSLTSPTFDFNFGVPDYIYYDGATYTTENLFYYHEQFMKELTSKFGKQLTCYVKITPEMINQLDFKKLINIDGVVYRLQSVKDYDSGKDQTTQVELIRIIKSEGLVAFNPPAPPYEPVSKRDVRVTEAGGITFNARSTEDNQLRIVE